MLANGRIIDQSIRLVSIAYDLERAADHAQNICESIVFAATGRLEEFTHGLKGSTQLPSRTEDGCGAAVTGQPDARRSSSLSIPWRSRRRQVPGSYPEAGLRETHPAPPATRGTGTVVDVGLPLRPTRVIDVARGCTAFHEIQMTAIGQTNGGCIG
jgi:hypothetical protein